MQRCKEARLERMTEAEAAGQPVLEVEAAVAVAPTNLLLDGAECVAIVAAHSKAKADATAAAVVAAPTESAETASTETAETAAVAPVPAPEPMEIESAAAEEPLAAEEEEPVQEEPEEAAVEGGGGRKRRSERRPEDCPTQMTADSGRRVSEVIGRSGRKRRAVVGNQ